MRSWHANGPAKQAIDIGEVRHERAEKIGERKILLGCNQKVRNASRGKSVRSGRLPHDA